MKRRIFIFAVVLAVMLAAVVTLGELVRVQVEKGDGIEAGYAGKVVEMAHEDGNNPVEFARTAWNVEEEVHVYVTGGVTNSVTNWIRVEGTTVTNELSVGDYVLPEDVLRTDGTNVVDVLLEF